MSFLNKLKPILRGQSAVAFRLSVHGDGGFRLLVTPTLQGIDTDTDDVELANLQALLSAPLALTLPADADLDQTFTEAVAQFQVLREPKLNELEALRARMAAADADAKKRAEEAKEEAKAKAAKAKAKTTPTKVASKPQPAPPPTGDMFGTPAEAPQPPAAEATATDTGEENPADDVDAEETLA